MLPEFLDAFVMLYHIEMHHAYALWQWWWSLSADTQIRLAAPVVALFLLGCIHLGDKIRHFFLRHR